MLAYLALIAGALAGYAGLQPWTIGASTVALCSLSYATYGHDLGRARDFGLRDVVDGVLWRSLLNALIASGAVYAAGWLFARL